MLKGMIVLLDMMMNTCGLINWASLGSPYFDDCLLPHNIDLMHRKKEYHRGTFCNTPGLS
jgi:hypothetical protein